MQSRAPGAYEYQRRKGFTRLPSRNTLRTYIGKSTGEVGMTRTIKQRLSMERKSLHDCECHVSLELDECALKPKRKLKKQWDKMMGAVDMGGVVKPLNRHVLANRMLAFVITGLSTHYKIPVAFFFVRNMTAAQLFQLTQHVLLEVEKLGFLVDRIVADNATTNVKMFKMWNGGELTHVVKHPVDPKRKLFLSFDPTHILKNVRNQFMDRHLNINGDYISFELIKKLYKIQKQFPCLRPDRRLTRKHVDPSNLERQKVQPAVDIFSDETIAAVLMLADHRAEGFQQVGPTVNFMATIGKWWRLHDVSSPKQHIRLKHPDKAPYRSVDDPRLKWLEEFVNDLEKWNRIWYETEEDGSDNFFTKETWEAIRLTTLATVDTVRYLLEDCKFDYVLTRRFSTDNVERLFANVRAMGGGNNKCDVTSATCAIDKITRTGIVESSIEQNVPLEKETRSAAVLIAETTTGPEKKQDRTRDLLKTMDPALNLFLEPLKNEPGKTIFFLLHSC